MAEATMNGCGSGGGASAGALLPASPFYAPRYHYGMLLGVDDLESEQAYHRGKLRLHNAWLHGPGVVWGMGVDLPAVEGSPGTLRGEIRVAAGFALDGAGRELHLEGAACVGVAAWLEENRDDPELQAVLVERPDGTLVFDAHVEACFRACLSRPVPSISEPCEGAGSDTAYSRARETVELFLRPGRAPARPRPYHRLRLLFALDDPRTDGGGTPVPEDQEVLDARAAILALPSGQQARGYLAAFRRYAALDGVRLAPAQLPEEGGTTLFPETDDACLVLADVTAITLTPVEGGGYRLASAAVDETVRMAHVATSTIQELLAGPLFRPVDSLPASESGPEAGSFEAAASGPAEPEKREAGPRPAAEGAAEPDAGGPRIDPASVAVEGETVTMTVKGRLARASVKEESFSVSAFDNRDGWRTVEIRDARVDRRGRITLDLTNDPGGSLVRIIARGTGPRPLLGTDGVPLAGAAGGPPAGANDGKDFVLMVKRSAT